MWVGYVAIAVKGRNCIYQALRQLLLVVTGLYAGEFHDLRVLYGFECLEFVSMPFCCFEASSSFEVTQPVVRC